MKLQVKVATTSKLIKIFVPNSTLSTGVGLTGLVYNTASLTAYYIKEGDASTTAINLVTMTLGTWASGGFVEVDATNMPGWYEVGLPNAAIASSASVGIHFQGAANMAPVPVEIELVAYNPQDTVRIGLTSLPNAAADAAGGIPISDAGGLDLDAILTDTNEMQGKLPINFIMGSGVATDQNSFIGAILTDTADMQPRVAAIEVDTNEIQGKLPTNEIMGSSDKADNDTVIDAIKAKTDNLPTEIKRNAAFAAFPFAMYSAVDHVTKVPGLTPSVYVAIDGGNYNAVVAAPAERTLTGIPTGSYYVDLSAAELNGKAITFMATAVGADTLELNITTTP